MPLFGRSHRNRPHRGGQSQHGPYGPGVGFGFWSGEQLAERRRQTAQVKGLIKRYPGMLPQLIDAMAGSNSGFSSDGPSQPWMSGWESMAGRGGREGGGREGGRGRSLFDVPGEDSWENSPRTQFEQPLQNPCAYQARQGAMAFGLPPDAVGRWPPSWPRETFRTDFPRGRGVDAFGSDRGHLFDELDDLRRDYYNGRFANRNGGNSGAGRDAFAFDRRAREAFGGPTRFPPGGGYPPDEFGAGRNGTRFDGPLLADDRSGGNLDYPQDRPYPWTGSRRESFERPRPGW